MKEATGKPPWMWSLRECMELQGSACGQASQAPGDEAHEHARFEDELLPIDCALVLGKDALMSLDTIKSNADLNPSPFP